MRHLVESFQSHLGERGCHFYDDDHCNFLTWKEVFKFIDSLPEKSQKDQFAEKLAETLANYNPDQEFLAVHQSGASVSVEVYSTPKPYEEKRFIR
jgi:hypothetical protein